MQKSNLSLFTTLLNIFFFFSSYNLPLRKDEI